MSIATAKRRRRQAKMGFKHLAKLGRPVYKKKSAEKSARRQMQVVMNERRMAAGKNKKSKS